MLTLTNLLVYPVAAFKRRYGYRNKAFVDDIAPPASIVPVCTYGEYCIKTEVTSHDTKGRIDQTFIGYSVDMNITNKTENACERYKSHNTKCGEPTLVIRGGDCKEVIFSKNKAGIIRELYSI